MWPAVVSALVAVDVRMLCDSPSFAAPSGLAPSSANLATHVAHAAPADYEYFALVLSVATLPSLAAAVRFVDAYSSHHSDSIVTEDAAAASTFCREPQRGGLGEVIRQRGHALCGQVPVRLQDGGRDQDSIISTIRFHACGPVGLEGWSSTST